MESSNILLWKSTYFLLWKYLVINNHWASYWTLVIVSTWIAFMKDCFTSVIHLQQSSNENRSWKRSYYGRMMRCDNNKAIQNSVPLQVKAESYWSRFLNKPFEDSLHSQMQLMKIDFAQLFKTRSYYKYKPQWLHSLGADFTSIRDRCQTSSVMPGKCY